MATRILNIVARTSIASLAIAIAAVACTITVQDTTAPSKNGQQILDTLQDGGSDSDASTVTNLASACYTLARAACARLEACGSSFPDGNCVECTHVQCKANYSATGVATTPADLVTCAADWSQFACGQIGYSLPTGCSKAGTLALGDACGAAQQCASGHCAGSGNRWPGAANFNADGTVQCGHCTPGLDIGGNTLTDKDSCKEGLTSGADYRCAKPLPEGSSCYGANGGIGYYACEGNLRCVGSTPDQHTCKKYVAQGGPCVSGARAPDCAAGLYCDTGDAGGARGTRGTCQINPHAPATRANDGAACDENAPCGFGAGCIDGSCTVYSPSMCK